MAEHEVRELFTLLFIIYSVYIIIDIIIHTGKNYDFKLYKSGL